jgi:hypothetical protein
MRAENLPPKKSAFKFAKEKLVSLFEKYSPEPVSQSYQAFIRLNNSKKTLENDLF